MKLKNPFKSLTIPDYSKPAPTLSPFQRAGQVWDDRMGKPTVRASHWRLVTFCLLGYGGLQTGLEYYREFNRPLPAYAVPVDGNGMKAGNGMMIADAKYVPSRNQVAADISEWIMLVRSRPADGFTLRSNLLSAEIFMDSSGITQLNSIHEKFDPYVNYKHTKDQSSKITVVVTGPDDHADKSVMTFPKVIPIEGDSYHAQWREVRWEYGTPGKPYLMTAVIRATAKGQTDERKMTRNPGGTAISWWEWRGQPVS